VKSSDRFVLRLVLGGVAIAVAALVITESQTLSRMAMKAIGKGEPEGPVVQIIERPVEIASRRSNPDEDSKTSADLPPKDATSSIAASVEPEADSTAPAAENTILPAPAAAAISTAPESFQQKGPIGTNRNRVALVVGNNDYQSVPRLRNAVTDATAIANMLRNLGFNVTLVTNVSGPQFAKTFDSWLSKIDRKSESVFFFAGHGVQVDGKNYLLSTDALFDADQGLPESTPSLQALMERWARRGPRFSIAIVDACRDNPFPVRTRSLSSAMTRSLEPTSAGSGQIILYSAGSGQTALDNLGPSDKVVNSVFTRALLKHMPNPNYSVDQVLRQTRMEVIDMARRAGYDQTPALYDESTGEFFFNPEKPGG
jgi:hypothetical protein